MQASSTVNSSKLILCRIFPLYGMFNNIQGLKFHEHTLSSANLHPSKVCMHTVAIHA